MDISKLIMSLPDMASFVVVVEEGSFSAASIKLGVTPSAVSRQVSRLEQNLAVKLLERTTRQMSLSVAGKPVYELCKTMLESAREAADVSSFATTEPEGLLRIAAPKAVAKLLLEPLLLSFAQQHPKIILQVKVSDHIIDPIANEVDLLVSLTAQPNLGLISKELREVKILLCASVDYLQKHGDITHPSQLSEHSCITIGESVNDDIFDMQYLQESVRVNVSGRYRVNHSQMRLNAILSGLGVGTLPDFVAAQAIADGRLVNVLPQWYLKHNYQGTLRLQYAQSKFIPERLKLLVKFLVDGFQHTSH